MRKTTIILLLILSGLLGFLFSSYMHRHNDEESNEIAAELTQTFHQPLTFVKQILGDPDAGRKIFKEFCATCHNEPPVIDVHAPRIGDKETWKLYNQLGISRLLQLTIEGRGAMPARGGCFECSDEQLKETIQYMLDQVR